MLADDRWDVGKSSAIIFLFSFTFISIDYFTANTEYQVQKSQPWNSDKINDTT